jgi:hypothetical protein
MVMILTLFRVIIKPLIWCESIRAVTAARNWRAGKLVVRSVDNLTAASVASSPPARAIGHAAVTLVTMPTLLTRIVGLLMLALALSVSSCQAVFPDSGTVNAPQQLNPGFTDGR